MLAEKGHPNTFPTLKNRPEQPSLPSRRDDPTWGSSATGKAAARLGWATAGWASLSLMGMCWDARWQTVPADPGTNDLGGKVGRAPPPIGSLAGGRRCSILPCVATNRPSLLQGHRHNLRRPRFVGPGQQGRWPPSVLQVGRLHASAMAPRNSCRWLRIKRRRRALSSVHKPTRQSVDTRLKR